MKVRILPLLLFISSFVSAQADLEQVSNKTAGNNLSDLQKLAEKLTSDDKSELAKVRSIFRWITDNIDYRVKQPSRRTFFHFNENDTSALQSLDERVAERVYATRLAVCEGYSRLFKTLCDYAGIEATVITGYGRVQFGRTGTKFRSNHTWNGVKIDGKWHLLDVTWATGHLTWNGGEFVRRYDERYFLTDPRSFIHDHYPDDLRWTLLDDPPPMAEYKNSPYKQRSFIKYQLNSFMPSKGVIEASVGDTLFFSITSEDAQKDKQVSADPFLDTATMKSEYLVILSPHSNDKKVFLYQHVLVSDKVQWIYLKYNDDLVLRYRVHIKVRLAVK